MSKIEMNFSYIDEVHDTIEKVRDAHEKTGINVWWQFEYGGEVIRRDTDDWGNIQYQIGRCFGTPGGKIFLAAENDSDIIEFRLRTGL